MPRLTEEEKAAALTADAFTEDQWGEASGEDILL